MQVSSHSSDEIISEVNHFDKMESESRLAVEVRKIDFWYKKRDKIIDGISIQIPEGKIYALLGSNGSGKTTLLRIVLGRLKPKSGYVRVFGLEPGSKHSDIPGPGVGYMPQDISLFNELTIEETLKYYGILYHIKSDDIQLRIKDLTELLNLPKKQRKINELSGGQQRLVSIAVTMIHRPRLLILDEPTVGVDSLLRFRIWQYLENICKNDGITVIITTHYIEEAKSASTVAFLNTGILLAQSNPNELLVKHNCKTLEDAFLKLCLEKSQERKNNTKELEMETKPEVTKNLNSGRDISHVNERKKFDSHHLEALLYKCYVRIKRNPLASLIFFITPVLQIVFFAICIGNKIFNLPVAVYNPDVNPVLSNLYINEMAKKNISCNIFDTFDSAIDSVIKGKNWIAISFAENFTDCFKNRFLDPFSVTNEEIGFSEIKLYPDISNFVIDVTLNRSILESFESFLKNFSSTLGYNPSTFALPLDYEQPIYGTTEFAFNGYLSPAITISTLHALPMVFATLLIILEKKSGHLERAYVSGIKPIEFLLSEMIQTIIAVFIQVSIATFVLFVIIDTPLEGSVSDVYALFVLQGLQGMTFGIFFAIVCYNEITAAILTTSIILPLWLSSGIIWPVEAIPSPIRDFLFWSPITQPTESIRSIMLRGLSIYDIRVQLGFAVSFIYTIMVTVINFILI